MASNAMALQPVTQPDPSERAMWAADQAVKLPVFTARERVVQEIDLGLRAGVRISFTPDKNSPTPAALLDLAEQIKSFEELPEGWDSYGALPLQDGAVLTAIQIAIAGINRCQTPKIIPLADGGIGLRWQKDDSELEIDIASDGQCEGILSLADGSEVELDDPSPASEAVEMIYQFCQG